MVKGLRSHQVRAWASVLTTIIVSASTWMVAMASPLLRIAIGTPTGIEGVTGVAVEAETLMHRDNAMRPATLLGLMDWYILIGLF